MYSLPGTDIQDGHDHHHIPSQSGEFRTDQQVALPHASDQGSEGPFIPVPVAGYLFLYPPVDADAAFPAPLFDFVVLSVVRLNLRTDADVGVIHEVSKFKFNIRENHTRKTSVYACFHCK